MTYERKRKEHTSDARLAAMAGLGVTGALAAHEGGSAIMRDAAENAAVPRTRSYDDFLGKLAPGDVVFHRKHHKHSAKADLPGGMDLPIKEADFLNGIKGDPYYHPSVYRGKGVVTDASGYEKGTKNTRLWQHVPEDLRVYRPKVKSAEKAKALEFVDSMRGTKYKGDADIAAHGLKHLLGVKVPTTGKLSAQDAAGIVCSELASEAYPSVFKDRLMSPKDMRHAPGMELIARYSHAAPISAREMALSRGLYPVLKNAKWGALAAGLGYGALKAKQHFDGRSDAQRA